MQIWKSKTAPRESVIFACTNETGAAMRTRPGILCQFGVKNVHCTPALQGYTGYHQIMLLDNNHTGNTRL